jgi:hypothetical protein
MTDDEESAYLEARAEAELSLAQSADHPAVVRAHYMMAGFYLDRLYNPEEEIVRESNALLAGRGRY